MVKITDNIYFVEAPNKARFPYCHCLLIADQRRVLMDSACGDENIRELLQIPIDIIVNTHFHEDHILGNYRFWPVQEPVIERVAASAHMVLSR